MNKFENWMKKYERYVQYFFILLFLVMLYHIVTSFRDNVTFYDASVLYELCKEKGGTLVYNQCFKEKINLEIPTKEDK
jgi:hypothetical protein